MLYNRSLTGSPTTSANLIGWAQKPLSIIVKPLQRVLLAKVIISGEFQELPRNGFY